MLPKFMSPFKVEEAQQPENQKHLMKKKKKKKLTDQKRSSTSSSSGNDDGGRRRRRTSQIAMDDGIGLRLVTQITNSHAKSNNVVVKSSLRKSNHYSSSITSCFLKTCSLCSRILSHDKDIYMYRGDQGFCSIECRNQQIVMDEMRELEESTKHNIIVSEKFWNDACRRRETRLILEDLRLHRLQSKPCAHHQNHWAILS
ncbi:LOW QUALITY PROTEIN: FCS-Like Zinc finger 17-like [Prosopis cineraria]|uniref:LOW QUALITY PROTEIN: FCS-Like Zinc finger 17-like n=1 Tax=Prosopis cineraria TaxID=364024 RepID=UPI0024103CE5|nr:LOW QUALITY PROTEIN: FCS-Like Zinc finger 17-like [Prosopis cineraria]